MAEVDIEDVKECFSLFDRKGDMKVEHDRIINVLRAQGLNPLTDEVNKCLETSGLMQTRVDFETFFGIYEQMSKAVTHTSFADMVEGLKTLDRDQTGMVSAAELRHVLMNVADKLTEEQVTDAVGPHEDSNGTVNYEELIKTVMSG